MSYGLFMMLDMAQLNQRSLLQNYPPSKLPIY